MGRRYTVMCACGLVLEALSKEGLNGIMRTHEMLEHESQRAPSIVVETRELRPVS